MTNRRSRFATSLAVLISVLVGSLVSPAGKADDINQDEALQLRRAGKIAPFQQILQAVTARYHDLQILEVELEAERGTYRYEINILLNDGSVRELEVDALSGKILEDELED